MRKIALVYLLCCSTFATFGQSGITQSFSFLRIPASARLAGLGGVNTSLVHRDVNFFFSNPALVGDTLVGFASINYQFYVADVGHSSVAYAHKFKMIGTVAFGVQHMRYGTLTGYDDAGQEIGDFSSGETALVISKSHQLNNFTLGVSLKPVFSSLAGYRANALLMDIGGVFTHPEKELWVGLAIKNVGFLFSEYSATSNTRIPFDVQAGVSFKPEHMPLRFSITAQNIATRNLLYNDPASSGQSASFAKRVASRFTIGTEVLLHRNVTVLLGYNYLARQELKLDNTGGGAGISMGFSAQIKAIEFIFSRSAYAIGNAGYTFTVSRNLNTLIRRN